MFFIKRAWAVLTVLGILLPTVSFAEDSSVLVAGSIGRAFDGFRQSSVRSLSARSKSFRSLEPINMAVQLPDGRTVTLKLTHTVQRYWPAYFVSDYGMAEDNAEVVLFRGESNDGSETLPLSGSVYMHNGVPTLFLDFPSSDKVTFYKLSIPLVEGDVSMAATLTAADSSELAHKSCGAEGEALGAAPRSLAPKSGNIGTSSLRGLQIATDADFEFFTRYGTESNARIASIINAADTIYQRDLGLDIQIQSQHVMTTSSQPYTSTAPSTILNQFVTYTNANHQLGSADLFHLFTGKDIDGSVIGTAYLSVACSTPSLSYGYSQDISTLTYLVFAHEVGHNLGADHDTTTGVTIMAPSLSSQALSFSSLSQGVIAAYIASYGSCLTSVDGPSPTPEPDPTPDPAPDPEPDPRNGTLSLSASFDQGSSRFTAVIEASDAAADDCRGYLRIGSDVTLVNGRTSAWGRKGSTVVQGSAKNKKRIAGVSPLFVQASYSCPSIGVQLFSDVQSISPVVVAPKQKVTATDKWIKAILKDGAKNANKRQNNQ